MYLYRPRGSKTRGGTPPFVSVSRYTQYTRYASAVLSRNLNASENAEGLKSLTRAIMGVISLRENGRKTVPPCITDPGTPGTTGGVFL